MNATGQRVVRNVRVGPNGLGQLLLFNQSTGVIQQVAEQIEGFWLEVNGLEATGEPALPRVESKLTEGELPGQSSSVPHASILQS